MIPIDTLKKTIILNKDYNIYFDIHRYLITASQENENENFDFPTHPMYALLFSFFTGKENLEKSLENISITFSISIEEAYTLIVPFIENPKGVETEYDNDRFYFPKNLLVYTENNIVRKDLNVQKEINSPHDFSSLRLYIPKSIVFVISTTCATDCFYCYADRKYTYSALSTKKIIQIIEEAKSIGVRDFSISGGEFFLHKDWRVILKKLLECGYRPEISTKVPLSKTVIDDFIKIGLNELQVSLDSVKSNLLKKTLKVSDSYCAQIVSSIRYMDSQGVKLTIKGTQSRPTSDVENIVEILDFLSTLKNVTKYVISIVGFSHYKTINEFHDFKATKKQIDDLRTYLETKKSTLNFDINYDDNVESKSELRNYTQFKNRSLCSGNVSGLVILPDGKVTICEELYWDENFILGDLLECSINEAWHSHIAHGLWDIQQTNLSDDNPCKNCHDFTNCRQGRGVCWKAIIAHYGRDKYLYPDPKCPKSPEFKYAPYYETL